MDGGFHLRQRYMLKGCTSRKERERVKTGSVNAFTRLIDAVLSSEAPGSVHVRSIEQATSSVRRADTGVFVPRDAEGNQRAVAIRPQPS